MLIHKIYLSFNWKVATIPFNPLMKYEGWDNKILWLYWLESYNKKLRVKNGLTS